MRFVTHLICISIILSHPTCYGNDITKYKKTKVITLLSGIGSRESIALLLNKRKLIPPHSYFVGIGYRHTLASTLFGINIEGIKHFGKQTSTELIFYPSIETPPLKLGSIGLSWNIGNGISTMIGPYPKFEKYGTIKSQRTLNLLVLEQNIFLYNKPSIQLKLRWHHRCHLFNTIAPRGSGSNFVALGIGYQI